MRLPVGFKASGVSVAGYDRVATDLTNSLSEEGIAIHYEDNMELVDSSFLDKETTLVVFTPAIPSEHQELTFFKEEGFEVLKRSQVLGLITQDTFTIAVAGTHGKTTTSSMIAHLLSDTPDGCSAFVGGIMTNTNSNLIIGKRDAPVVVEADEYDRSFMQLYPNITVITSLDPDHLDIYGNETQMLDTYEAFVKRTPAEGKVLMSSKAGFKINPGNDYISYDLKNGDVIADALRIANGAFVFTYRHGMEKIVDIQLEVPGYHNVENALAAITVALAMGMDGPQIRKRFKSYAGVKRRFEYVYRSPNVVLIDDYAHHPEEIEAFLQSVRSLSKDRKVTAIFQPHLFSRTNDFKKGFANALDKADEIILLDIYPAREAPIEGVTTEVITEWMENKNRVVVSKEDLLTELDKKDLDVVLTIGAGDIDREVPKVASYLKKRYGRLVPENERLDNE